jgi:hypothetical protein
MEIFKEMLKEEFKIQELNRIIQIIMFMVIGFLGIRMGMMNREKNRNSKDKEDKINNKICK